MVYPSSGKDISVLHPGSGSNITHCIKFNSFSAGKSDAGHTRKGETFPGLLCDTRGGSNHIQSRANDMILAFHSDAGYLNEYNAQSRTGDIFICKECTFTPNNGAI